LKARGRELPPDLTLLEGEIEPKCNLTLPRGERKPATLDIAMIGAASFHWISRISRIPSLPRQSTRSDYIIDKKLQAKYNESDDRVE